MQCDVKGVVRMVCRGIEQEGQARCLFVCLFEEMYLRTLGSKGDRRLGEGYPRQGEEESGQREFYV